MRMLLGLDTPTAVDIPCPRVRPRPRRDLEPGDALEWRKCWSVKSNVFGVLAAIMVGIGLGWIFSSVAGTGDARGPSSGSPLEVRLAGFNLGQIILGVFGVPTVTTEYSSGLIRSTFTAVGRRIPVLCAKVVTYGLVSLAAMTVAVLAAFLASIHR